MSGQVVRGHLERILLSVESFYPEFKEKPYLEQWERVERWYEKLMKVKHGVYRELDHKELLDIVYAYFLNTQHFKDWLKDSRPDLEDDIKNFLEKNIQLVVLSDFVNKHKHPVRKNKKVKDPESKIVSQSVRVTTGTIYLSTSKSKKIENRVLEEEAKRVVSGAKYYWEIEHDGQKINAYHLARDTFELWVKFLTEKNLL